MIAALVTIPLNHGYQSYRQATLFFYCNRIMAISASVLLNRLNCIFMIQDWHARYCVSNHLMNYPIIIIEAGLWKALSLLIFISNTIILRKNQEYFSGVIQPGMKLIVLLNKVI